MFHVKTPLKVLNAIDVRLALPATEEHAQQSTTAEINLVSPVLLRISSVLEFKNNVLTTQLIILQKESRVTTPLTVPDAKRAHSVTQATAALAYTSTHAKTNPAIRVSVKFVS